jgi:hypothetical protein
MPSVDPQRTLQNINENLIRLKIELKYANGGFQYQSIQDEITEWEGLKNVLLDTLQAHREYEQYIHDHDPLLRSPLSSSPRRQSTSDSVYSTNASHEKVSFLAKRSHKRDENIVNTTANGAEMEDDAEQFCQAASEVNHFNQRHFKHSLTHFFRGLICCGGNKKEQEPLIKNFQLK